MTKRLADLRERPPWRVGAVAMVVLAVLAVGGERALAWQDEKDRIADEQDSGVAASAEAEGLIDISGSTSEEDVAKLLDGATAGFRSELEGQADRLRRTLAKNKVAATGEVVSTGLVKLEDGRAIVIVAAVGTVKNKQTAKAEPRNYRLRVDLQDVDGRWLVSGLEFVA